MSSLRAVFVILGLVFATASAANEQDPWESFNRRVFVFNEYLDRVLVKPVAEGYQRVTPEPVNRAVTHFFNNLDDLGNAMNFTLQGEGEKAVDSGSRLVVNTILGIGGVLDPASAGGIPRQDTSFGTTLGKWGAPGGPYVVLPFWGSSTVRDFLGIPVDRTVHPLDGPYALDVHDRVRIPLSMLEVVDLRADLLRYEQLIVGDRYSFLRDAYLQRREFEVHGQKPSAEDPFLDEDFGDEDAPPAEVDGEAVNE